VSRSYPAELADVWDACTNPERIPRWFLPVSGELKEGGRYLHLTTRRPEARAAADRTTAFYTGAPGPGA
jgi:uncharacterized protein YndB with AHSA1/START domain